MKTGHGFVDFFENELALSLSFILFSSHFLSQPTLCLVHFRTQLSQLSPSPSPAVLIKRDPATHRNSRLTGRVLSLSNVGTKGDSNVENATHKS